MEHAKKQYAKAKRLNVSAVIKQYEKLLTMMMLQKET